MLAIPRRIAVSSVTLAAILALGQVRGSTLYQAYRDVASRLVGEALRDREGWEKLAYLCDHIGHRLSGSPQLERAVQWAAEEMKKDGLENVLTPRVMVPHWVRGQESAEMLEPYRRPLFMLGLGGSVATSPEGVTAEVVPVRDFAELERLGEERLRGKIVLFNAPWQGYGPTVVYRTQGASRAARLGAAASLVRSVTPRSLQTPHTGAMLYAAGVPRIPAAAVSVEDAELIQRLADSGSTVRVRLSMQARMLPDAESANVIGEIPGRERPEEIVVIGGHIDSWDVGQGAHDDGAGVVAAMQAAALIRKLGLQPRRTLRVVLWTNEENGLAGARAYREWIGEGIRNHVAAIEMDGGAETPVGFGLGLPFLHDHPDVDAVYERLLARLREVGRLGAGQITRGEGGADIGPLMREGVPGLGLNTVGRHYFDWHHTHADTLDKVDPQDLRRCIAVLAVMAFVLADMPERLDELARPE